MYRKKIIIKNKKFKRHRHQNFVVVDCLFVYNNLFIITILLKIQRFLMIFIKII